MSCPDDKVCENCPCSHEDDVCFPQEREIRLRTLREVADFLEDRADGTFIGSLQSASWAIRKDLLHEEVPEADARW